MLKERVERYRGGGRRVGEDRSKASIIRGGIREILSYKKKTPFVTNSAQRQKEKERERDLGVNSENVSKTGRIQLHLRAPLNEFEWLVITGITEERRL